MVRPWTSSRYYALKHGVSVMAGPWARFGPGHGLSRARPVAGRARIRRPRRVNKCGVDGLRPVAGPANASRGSVTLDVAYRTLAVAEGQT